MKTFLILLTALLAQTQTKPAKATYQQLNSALGLALWSSDNLWNNQAAVVAQRLKLPQESKTSYDSSYRLYPQTSANVMGEHAYSLSLDGDASGNITDLSIIFANLGDAKDLAQNSPNVTTVASLANGKMSNAQQAQMVTAVRNAIQAESANITKQLTALLGKFTYFSYGSDQKTAEVVQRWDWNGHAILLASEKDKYLALRIVPTAMADRKNVKMTNWDAFSKQLGQRVAHRDNGDVVIQDLPMVNQGPKGYCVPATWCRALRYMGIPADLYQIALADSTGVGGGTSFAQSARAVDSMVHAYGYHLVNHGGTMQLANFTDKIDRGLPVMWGMFVVDQLNSDLSDRMADRGVFAAPDGLEAYNKVLQPARFAAPQIRTDRNNAHMCLIIGYNKKSNELAISDSWGPNFAERWITVEEAQAISQGQFLEISW